MKKVVLLFVAIYIGLISDIVPLASAADSSKGFAFTDKVVLAYYYIWFNENNWIKTKPGEGWFTLPRLYAPLKPILDKTWRWNDIERIE